MASEKNKLKLEAPSQMPFTKMNFIVIGISALMIILGFILMVGGGPEDPSQFSADIFSSTRIVVGPLLAFLGFVGIGIGIIVKPRDKKQ